MTRDQRLELLKLNQKILNLLRLCNSNFLLEGVISRDSMIDTQKTIIDALIRNPRSYILSDYETQLELDLAALAIVQSYIKQETKELNKNKFKNFIMNFDKLEDKIFQSPLLFFSSILLNLLFMWGMAWFIYIIIK